MRTKKIRKLLELSNSIDNNVSSYTYDYKSLVIDGIKKLDAWKPTKQRAVKKCHYQLFDFFCGAGGMSLGFAAISKRQPFYSLLGGLDIDSEAAKSYEKNFDAPVLVKDIRDYEEEPERIYDHIKSLPRYNKNIPLVLIGCAPCQGFTSHRKKNWNKIDNRNDLVLSFAKIAAHIKPACIIMENVPELLSDKFKNYYKKTKKILQDAGYIVKANIYNSSSFYVAQNRNRALLIAMKKEFILPSPILKSEEAITVRDMIETLPLVNAGEECKTDSFHKSANHKNSTLEIIQAVPKNGGSRPQGIGPKCLDKVKGFSDVYGRLYWDRPAITLTRYCRNPASGRYIHPEQDRGLTMREAALIQSFPKGFEFIGSFDSIFKQIGESVPPRLSASIAIHSLIELSKGE